MLFEKIKHLFQWTLCRGVRRWQGVIWSVFMAVRVKWLLVLAVLTVLDLGPFPIVSMFGIYLVLFRPGWFWEDVKEIYGKSGEL
jgi:hypothetical protein